MVGTVSAAPASAAFELRPPVDEIPSVHEVPPLAAPSGTARGDTTTLDDAQSAEDAEVGQDDSDLGDGSSSTDEAKALEDAVKECFISALLSIAGSYSQGQSVNFIGTLWGDLVDCLKEKLLGVDAPADEENENAISALASDLTGQMGTNAQPVVATGLSAEEFASWLEAIAGHIPANAASPASTTTTSSLNPKPPPGKSSSPIIWIVIGIVVVGGAAVVFGRR
jgi:hypothetical protein